MLVDVEHPSGVSLKIADTPVKLSRTPGGIQGPPPALGEHTDEVLRTCWGYRRARSLRCERRKRFSGRCRRRWVEFGSTKPR